MSASRSKQKAEKAVKGLGIESRGLLGQQSASFQTHCSEETNLLTSRSRKDAWLFSSGSPSTNKTAGSLKMNLVLCSNLDGEIFHPFSEFFLKISCSSGSASAACRRGLCKLNPKRWKRFWHCLTCRRTEKLFSR